MRNLLIAIILVVFCSVLFAEENEVPTFANLVSKTYNHDIRISSEMQKIYVTSEFSVDPASLIYANYYSVFMNKDIHVEQITVNGKPYAPVIATGLTADHFNPVFPYPQMLADSSLVACHGYKLDDYKAQPDMINFRIRYWFPLPEWQKDAMGMKYVSISTDEFQFPRNLVSDSQVNLKMISSEYYKLKLDTPCEVTNNDGILTQKGSFTDSPTQANKITIYIKR